MQTKSWFDVDKEGLARILRRRGLEFVAYELISNAWDSNATKVEIKLESLPNRPLAVLTVEDDDADGFADITHAFTMFADSLRRGDTSKRGRFNLGEKLVLAVAEEAEIKTTKASIKFDSEGRHILRQYRDKGSRIEIKFKANREQVADILDKIRMVIPPIPTFLNGQELKAPVKLKTVEMQLATVIPDEDGVLKHTARKTTVDIYESAESYLYELGIPVVETDDKYSYNINQKVPLNMDRDNVPPSYLRTLRVFALNDLHDKLNSDDCNKTWVRDALSDSRVNDDAVASAITKRFGDKVVVFDPSDPEANSLAFSQGYTVIHGTQLSKAEWENVKRTNFVKSAGQVTPSPKAFSENGTKTLTYIPESEWTEGMRMVVSYAKELAKELINKPISVKIVKNWEWHFGGCYGGGELTLNRGVLGKDWFDQIDDNVVALLIHELAHEYESDHLSDRYHKAICKMGAKMRNLKHLEDNIKVGV